MVELNHNVVSFNSDTLIKGNHGVLVAVFVTKKGSGSNKTPVECTIFTAIEGNYQNIHRRFENGIFADCDGTAEVTVVFK